MKTLLFVCHGNICRSIAAEAIANMELKQRGLDQKWRAISRATSFEEIGNPIYPPMARSLADKGIPVPDHRATRITQADYEEATFVYYMDESNRRALRHIVKDHKGTIASITSHCPDLTEIEDPWYTGRYDLVRDQIARCVHQIIDMIDDFENHPLSKEEEEFLKWAESPFDAQ